MQYLLSQEEYDRLLIGCKEQEQTLQDLCTKVANHMPVRWGWGEPDDPKPWGCILTRGEWYCDKCPVQKVCPYMYKKFSK